MKNDIHPGSRFGSWTVIALDDGQHRKKSLCRCDCGTERWVVNYTLRTGKSKSCGCKSYKEPPKYPIKTGDRIGHWTLIEQRRTKFLCRCDCGSERLISAYNLMHGRALECKNCAAKNIQDVMAQGNKIMRPLQAKGLAPKYVGFGRRAKKLPRSGITGVYIQKGKYRAEITVDKKRIFLGSFTTLAEATAARKDAEIKYFGPRQKLADEIKEQIKKDGSQ